MKRSPMPVKRPVSDHPLLGSRSAIPDSSPSRLPGSLFLLGAAAILLGAAAGRWWAFDVTQFRGDELTYTNYATRISTAGLTEFRLLVAEYASNPSRWSFPNPLRVLYILITALSCKLAGACSGTVVAAVSFVSGIGLVLLTLVMAWRMCGERVALLAGLLVAFSPLQLALSRRAWQDGFFSLTVLLALWAFWERSRSARKGWDLVLGCALLAALLTKESAPILVLGFLGTLLYRKFSTGVPLTRSTLTAVLVPLPLTALILLALIQDPWLVTRVYGGWLSATDAGPYVTIYSQGPWFRYLIDFLLLSPLTTLLAIGYYFTPGRERGDPFLGRFTLILFVLFSLISLKNIRYVSFLDIPMRILAVLALTSVFHLPAVARVGERGAMVTTLLLAAYDLSMFYAIFIGGGVYDPLTATLAQAARLIP